MVVFFDLTGVVLELSIFAATVVGLWWVGKRVLAFLRTHSTDNP